MQGILLVSHGDMAKGMLDAAQLFMGEDIPQLDFLGLKKEDSAEAFGKQIGEKLKALDTGDGVLVLADLFGGTPCNQTLFQLRDGIEVVAGFNLATLIEALSSREIDAINPTELADIGRSAMCDVRQVMAARGGSSDGDEYED